MRDDEKDSITQSKIRSEIWLGRNLARPQSKSQIWLGRTAYVDGPKVVRITLPRAQEVKLLAQSVPASLEPFWVTSTSRVFQEAE